MIFFFQHFLFSYF